MRQEGSGRDTVLPGGNPYTAGECVFATYYGCAGTVVAVSNVISPLIVVRWGNQKDAMGDIIYPADTPLVRRAWPWE